MIRIADVTREYGDREALAGVTLDIEPGLCVVTGRNGSGKSTLLRLIAGLAKPSSGTIDLDGAEPGSTAARRRVSYVGDTPILYDDLAVRDHLEVVARLHDVTEWEGPADHLLELLGLSDRRSDLARTLSRGLRQRLALAIGFVRPFAVILIDEPVVGLDASGRSTLVELLQTAVIERNVTALVATHQDALVGLASRVVTLEDGLVVGDVRPVR